MGQEQAAFRIHIFADQDGLAMDQELNASILQANARVVILMMDQNLTV